MYYKEDNPIEKSEYDIMKENFEKNNFKILHPLKYCTIDSFGKLHKNDKTTFISLHENLFVNIDINNNGGIQKRKVKFINKWLEDVNMRVYEKFDFLPKQIYNEKLIYNTFTHFKAELKPLVKTDIENSLIMKHIKKLFITDENVNYFLKWLAVKVKCPAKLTGVALVLVSIQGTGKDTLFNYISNNIIGSNYCANDEKIDLFFGRFNSLIENKLICVLNETSGSKTYDISNIIKNSLTKEVNLIENKGQTPYENKNHINWVFFSNSSYPIKVEQSDRRFWAIECGDSHANDEKYFNELNDEIQSEVYDRAFYEYLLKQDVENFSFVNNRPITEYYKSLKEMSIPVQAIFLNNLIEKTYKHIENGNMTDTFYNENKLFIGISSNELYLKFINWKKYVWI